MSYHYDIDIWMTHRYEPDGTALIPRASVHGGWGGGDVIVN